MKTKTTTTVTESTRVCPFCTNKIDSSCIVCKGTGIFISTEKKTVIEEDIKEKETTFVPIPYVPYQPLKPDPWYDSYPNWPYYKPYIWCGTVSSNTVGGVGEIGPSCNVG
jgi:hypothetical protein